jgi:hypothetical protein
MREIEAKSKAEMLKAKEEEGEKAELHARQAEAGSKSQSKG